MMKYYVSPEGAYLGAFNGDAPAGGVAVDTPPDDAFQVWKNGAWQGPIETPPPLKDITRAQLIDVLLDLDVYEAQVTSLLEAEDYSGEPDPAKAKARALNAWKNASYYRPDHPLIDQMRAVLNLTDQTQFEALWRAAETRLV
jgi:hypothetical protein